MERSAELSQRFLQEPLANHFGLKLASLGSGCASITMEVRPEHCITGGIAQGGITTTLADYAGVYAAMARIPAGHTPARRISIELFRPVKEGETIVAHASVAEETRSSLVAIVRVTDETGKTKALATITFAKPRS